MYNVFYKISKITYSWNKGLNEYWEGNKVFLTGRYDFVMGDVVKVTKDIEGNIKKAEVTE